MIVKANRFKKYHYGTFVLASILGNDYILNNDEKTAAGFFSGFSSFSSLVALSTIPLAILLMSILSPLRSFSLVIEYHA